MLISVKKKITVKRPRILRTFLLYGKMEFQSVCNQKLVPEYKQEKVKNYIVS